MIMTVLATRVECPPNGAYNFDSLWHPSHFVPFPFQDRQITDNFKLNGSYNDNRQTEKLNTKHWNRFFRKLSDGIAQIYIEAHRPNDNITSGLVIDDIKVWNCDIWSGKK